MTIIKVKFRTFPNNKTDQKDDVDEHGFNSVKQEHKGIPKEETTVFACMEKTILHLKEMNQTGTASNYRAALNKFKQYRNQTDLLFGEIDHKMMKDYERFLLSTGMVPNSASFYLRILRAVYNQAVENELTYDCKPFRNVFTGTEKTLKRAISYREMKLIKKLDLSSQPKLEKARDLFLFLFYCRGMSFIDAAFLKKSDVQNGIITYRRHKTKQILHIKLVGQINELIERYSQPLSPYLLPIIEKPFSNERRQYETALRNTNLILKEIGSLAGLSIPLTTYVARHSWATIAKSKNVPINVISDALGHDNTSTTQIYLASIDASVIDKVNEMIIKDL